MAWLGVIVAGACWDGARTEDQPPLCACETRACVPLSIDGVMAAKPDSKITIAGITYPLVASSDAVITGWNVCHAELVARKTSFYESAGYAFPEAMAVDCTWNTESVHFRVLPGDLRDASPGALQAPLRGLFSSGGPDGDWTAPAQVVVEEAAGGSAPLPDVVTPDFRKGLRFEINAALPSGELFVATIRLTITAAEYHAGALQTCNDCAC